MDMPPLFLTPDRCESLGLSNTETPSMTAKWGLTEEHCEMWQCETERSARDDHVIARELVGRSIGCSVERTRNASSSR